MVLCRVEQYYAFIYHRSILLDLPSRDDLDALHARYLHSYEALKKLPYSVPLHPCLKRARCAGTHLGKWNLRPMAVREQSLHCRKPLELALCGNSSAMKPQGIRTHTANHLGVVLRCSSLPPIPYPYLERIGIGHARLYRNLIRQRHQL